MRLIDADALMQTLGITDMDCGKCAWYSKAYRQCKRGGDFEDACCAIEDAPTIEAVPVVHGHWEPVTNGRGGFECSKCHHYAPSYQDGVEWISEWCPSCGAIMNRVMEGAEDAGRDE